MIGFNQMMAFENTKNNAFYYSIFSQICSGKYDVVQFSQCMCSLHYTLRYSETACQGFAHDYAIPVGAVSTSAFINFYFFPAHLVQQRMGIKPAAPVRV